MNENWYQRSSWDDDAHIDFYKNYRLATKEIQEEAILTQAKLLANNLDETILKAAESLLLLWIADHFDKQKAKGVYELTIDVCKKMGDIERANQFENYLKSLKRR
jgi:hypothetical protein